jgi:quercetin dioxygenase-like cupin family protein
MTARGQLPSQNRIEAILSGAVASSVLSEGVQLQELVNARCEAEGFSTGIVTFAPGARLGYHRHPISEAIIVVEGVGQITIEGRCYLLEPLDCLHVPAEVAHEVTNPATDAAMVAFSAFASNRPSRGLVAGEFRLQERGQSNPNAHDPESIVRGRRVERYEPSEGARFVDLFASRFGSIGICGGYGRFDPGASLPCHFHKFDESISIVEGEAVCLVQGNRYLLSNCDTAFVPEGRPHRFLNLSDAPMAMIWVYAGNEPERVLIGPEYCDGSVVWPGSSGSVLAVE